eukprot:1158788-Pelagomonas_calceolata.AAC.5
MNWEHPGTGLVLLNLISKLPGWMGIKPCNPPSHCNPPIDIILLLPVRAAPGRFIASSNLCQI